MVKKLVAGPRDLLVGLAVRLQEVGEIAGVFVLLGRGSDRWISMNLVLATQ
jgi:hypothetical protein